MARKQTKPLKAKVSESSPFYGIIQDAYRVFACDTPSDIGVLQWEMETEIAADFFNPSIAELPLHYLRDWFWAITEPTFSQHIWKYLLPRVLEVLACGEDLDSSGTEVSLRRFPTGERSNWNDAEWDVLDRFQRLYLLQAAESNTEYLDDVLCMFGIAQWPLDDLLTQVFDLPDTVLVPRLWTDWCTGRPCIWINAFWERDESETVFNFYSSRDMYNRMERLGLSEDFPLEMAHKARAVADVIRAQARWAPKD